MSSEDERPVGDSTGTESKPHKAVRNNAASADSELDQRLAQLKSKLGDSQAQHNLTPEGKPAPKTHSNQAGVAQAFRLSSEFIAGVVVGAGIGYLVDIFFGTSPWGLIVFLMLGFAAAVLNVMRAAGMVAESNMRFRPAQELHKQQLEGETDDTTEK